MKILTHESKDFIGRAISLQSDGPESHVSTLFSDGWQYQAQQFKGFHKQKFDYTKKNGIKAYSVIGITAGQILACRQWCDAHLGTPYDYWGVIRFISRGRLPHNEKLFCSEAVTTMLEAVELPLFNTPPYMVAPCKVPWSIRLKLDTI